MGLRQIKEVLNIFIKDRGFVTTDLTNMQLQRILRFLDSTLIICLLRESEFVYKALSS